MQIKRVFEKIKVFSCVVIFIGESNVLMKIFTLREFYGVYVKFCCAKLRENEKCIS